MVEGGMEEEQVVGVEEGNELCYSDGKQSKTQSFKLGECSGENGGKKQNEGNQYVASMLKTTDEAKKEEVVQNLNTQMKNWHDLFKSEKMNGNLEVV